MVPAPLYTPLRNALTQAASTGNGVARVLMAAAGLCAVHAVKPRRARQVTAAGAQGQGDPQWSSLIPPALAPIAGQPRFQSSILWGLMPTPTSGHTLSNQCFGNECAHTGRKGSGDQSRGHRARVIISRADACVNGKRGRQTRPLL